MQSIKRIENLPTKKVLPAHHSLDINVDIISKIADAFDNINVQGKLQQGSGIFTYEDFSIHI